MTLLYHKYFSVGEGVGKRDVLFSGWAKAPPYPPLAPCLKICLYMSSLFSVEMFDLKRFLIRLATIIVKLTLLDTACTNRNVSCLDEYAWRLTKFARKTMIKKNIIFKRWGNLIKIILPQRIWIIAQNTGAIPERVYLIL